MCRNIPWFCAANHMCIHKKIELNFDQKILPCLVSVQYRPDFFHYSMYQSKPLMFFDGCDGALGCSVCLRGGTEEQLAKVLILLKCLSVCLFICVFICISIYLQIYSPVYLFICLSFDLYMSCCISTCLFICISIYLYICVLSFRVWTNLGVKKVSANSICIGLSGKK